MEDAECPICFEEVSDPRLCVKCSQIFCAQCIANVYQQYSLQKRPCPHCRGYQVLADFIRVPSYQKLLQSLKTQSEELKRRPEAIAEMCPSHVNESRVFFCAKRRLSMCRKCDCDCGAVHSNIEDAREDAEQLWSSIEIKNRKGLSLQLEKTKGEMKSKANLTISQIFQKIQERLEKEIAEKTEPLKQAVEKWEAFEEDYRDDISAIEEAKESDFLNRMADVQPLMEKVRSGTAEVKRNLPLISNINLDVDAGALLASCIEEISMNVVTTNIPQVLEQLVRVADTDEATTKDHIGTISFKASAQVASSGTTIKFVSVAGHDTMMKNNREVDVNTKHQCITVMKEFESKSLEELRFEDYAANSLFKAMAPAATGSLFGTTASNKHLFGATTTISGGLFRTQASAATPTLFGAVATPVTGSIFSSKPATSPYAILAPTAASTFTFGAQQPTTTGGLFATQPQAGKSLFSQPTTTTAGLFGATATPAIATTATPVTGSIFSSKPATSPFALPASTAASTFTFGAQQPTTTGGLFATQPQAGKSLFSQPTTTTAGLFGATSTPAFATTFGAKPVGQAIGLFAQPTVPTATPVFSFNTTQLAGPGLFGPKPATSDPLGATPSILGAGASSTFVATSTEEIAANLPISALPATYGSGS